MEIRTPARRHPPSGTGGSLSFAALKERQLLFLLTRQLAEAQFVQADADRTHSLWQEAAALELDPDRIITLLYGVADHNDLQEMEEVDRQYRLKQPSRRENWWTRRLNPLTGRGGGGWHRTVQPAGSPAHP